MERIKFLFVFLILLPTLLFASDGSDVVSGGTDVLRVTTLRLRNGLTVWINEDHSQPKVYGAVIVRAGSNQCPGTGIAHYFEHLMFKGTRKIGTTGYADEKPWLDSIAACYDRLAATTDAARRRELQMDINRLSLKAADYAIPNEFNNLISRFGGTGLNAYTSYDETVYHNVFSPQYLDQWLELNSERLVDPVFRLFQSELETVYEEKNRASDNMLAGPALKAASVVFDGTPYAQPILGTTENLKNPRLSQMRQFFNDYYVAGNMGLVLCGDVCTDSVEAKLEATFGRLRPGMAPRQSTYTAKTFDGSQTIPLKLPVPIIKGVAFAFHAPTDKSDDYIPLQVALRLLTNDAGSGLLDSLGNESQVLGAMAVGYSFKDQGIAAIGAIPNLLGSKKKAERLLWQQVDRLQTGLFSAASLEAVKIEMLSQAKRVLESIDERAALMVTAFSHGFSWGDYVRHRMSVAAVAKSDVVCAVGKYLQPQKSMRFVKKFGSYPKEHISQPGYQPVAPRHAATQSDYAKRLEQWPVAAVTPRYVDFERDAERDLIAPLVTFYRVENPVNDLFTLKLQFHRDATKDRRQWLSGDYVGSLGTDSLTRQQLADAFSQLGARVDIASDRQGVSITLHGIDRQLDSSVRLLAHYLARVKGDNRKMKDLVSGVKVSERAFLKENANLFSALMAKVEYGEQSPYLDRLTAKDLKRLGSEALLSAFREALRSQCDIIYTGQRSSDEVKAVVRSCFDLATVTHPYTKPAARTLRAHSEATVYVYDNPSARQTIIGNYQQLPAASDILERQQAALWANYLGGGMSSVLFQHIREYRSLAYSSSASLIAPSLKLYPESPMGFFTATGTQADKAMTALSCLDSLLADMPVNGNNFATSKQQLINRSYQSYPGFRDLGSVIAAGRLKGYDKNPNADFDAALRTVTVEDMMDYYRRHVQQKTRVYVVVGDKTSLDLRHLALYGTVVEVKRSDIYK